METALLVLVGVVLTLGVGALYYWFVGPAEHTKGMDDAAALQKAKADGLLQGAQVVEKVVEGETKKVDERAAAEHKLDPVDFANALLERKKKS